MPAYIRHHEEELTAIRLFEREEILQRLADFKANQQKFQREREDYCNKTIKANASA